MHADLQYEELMQNVQVLIILLRANAFMGMKEIPSQHVTHVSMSHKYGKIGDRNK